MHSKVCWSLIVVLGLIYGISAPAVDRDFTFNLKDGRALPVSLSTPDTPSTVWYVLVTGSPCFALKAREDVRKILSADGSGHSNLLIINKYGTNPTGGCLDKDEFNRHYLRDERIENVKEALLGLIPADADIILSGGSEGSYIVPAIARGDSRIKGLVLQNAGTRGWIEEAQKTAANTYLMDMPTAAKIIADPSPLLFFDGLSYRTWKSFNVGSYMDLESLNVPVLVITGALDKNVWVEGLAEDMRSLIALGKPIEFHLVPGVDHQYYCVDHAVCGNENLFDSVVKPLIQNFLIKLSLH